MRPGPILMIGIVALGLLVGAIAYPGLLMIGIPLLLIIAAVAIGGTYAKKRDEQRIAAGDDRQTIHKSDRTVGPARG